MSADQAFQGEYGDHIEFMRRRHASVMRMARDETLEGYPAVSYVPLQEAQAMKAMRQQRTIREGPKSNANWHWASHVLNNSYCSDTGRSNMCTHKKHQ